MSEPYLGLMARRIATQPIDVDGRFLARCFVRWRALPSLRDAAKQISVLDEDETKRRKTENDYQQDRSGLNVSYETISKIDRVLREGTPDRHSIGTITYFLLCAWMGEEPDLPDSAIPYREYYTLWRMHYDHERRRKRKQE